MRRSPIHDQLAARGAEFEEQAGVERALRFSTYSGEYRAVREGVGITDFSFATRYKVPEEGLDVFERYAAGNVANIRFGRVLHTLAADSDGMIESDLYVANDDEEIFLIGENLVEDEKVSAVLRELGGEEAGLVDLTSETVLLGIDGFNAWAVAKELFGTDVLGLPYLSIETYDLDGCDIKLIRAGKTSEFGYLLMAPNDAAGHLLESIEKAGEVYDIKHIGLDAHLGLRLDGRFFNIHSEGREVRDPLALGLQWMIDFEEEEFRGREAILERRAAGPEKKIIGIQPLDTGDSLEKGDQIVHQHQVVAKVVSAADSPLLGTRVGLALFDWQYAYSGLEYERTKGGGIKTISMPPFTAKSLTVRLDEM